MFAGASPITPPPLRQKRTRSKGAFLRRHYPASTVLSPFPIPARAATRGDVEAATLARDGPPRLPVSPSLRAVPTTPADRNGCIRRLLPRSTRPSPNLRRVGVHIFTFEACSGFTRVRPARSLNRPRRPLSQGFGPAGYPTRPPVNYQIKPTTVWGGSFLHWCYAPSGALRMSGSSSTTRIRSSNSLSMPFTQPR